MVLLTVAGAENIPIDVSSDLYRNLVAALGTYGDPGQPVQVCERREKLLIISAGVQLQPLYTWDAVAPVIREAVGAIFSFDARDLGQPAYLSEAISAIQGVEGVSYVDVKIFDSVAEDTTVAELAALGTTLRLNPVVASDGGCVDVTAKQEDGPCRRIRAAELVFLNTDLPETLILSQIGV
jgi:hypothetical protein